VGALSTLTFPTPEFSLAQTLVPSTMLDSR